MNLSLSEVLGRLDGVRQTVSGYQAKCPAHDDQNPSLSVQEKDGKVLIKCHTGCTFEQVKQALGAPIQAKANPKPEAPKRIVANYPYTDEKGNLLFEVVRYEPKTFRQRQWLPDGTWKYSMEGCRKVLFQLPKVIAAIASQEIVYLCEGEKDVLSMEGLGVTATTNPMGANKWDSGYSQALKGAKVIVIVDNDEAGVKHAERLLKELGTVPESLTFVQAKEGKDATDHINAGHGLADFVPYEPRLMSSKERHTGLMSLSDLYDKPDEESSWVIDGLIPTGSFCSLIAKPKVGKSSLVREIIRSVATGEPFLGREVLQGPVIYLALEEREQSLKDFCKSMGIPKDSPVYIALRLDQCSDFVQLEEMVNQYQPVLVIIDTLIRFASVRDLNDYAEVSKVLGPFTDFCRSNQVSLLVTHHAKKGDGDDAGDSTLGSTAILASVDTQVNLRSDKEKRRKIETVQRYGVSMESTLLEFDEVTKRVTLGATVEKAILRNMEEQILDLIGDQEMLQSEITAQIKGPRVHSMLNILLDNGKLSRSGTGFKGSPYSYRKRTLDSLSPFSHIYENQENKKPDANEK